MEDASFALNCYSILLHIIRTSRLYCMLGIKQILKTDENRDNAVGLPPIAEQSKTQASHLDLFRKTFDYSNRCKKIDI